MVVLAQNVVQEDLAVGLEVPWVAFSFGNCDQVSALEAQRLSHGGRHLGEEGVQ